MSTDCARIRQDLGGYVLGALEPEEAQAVREHLLHCSACAAQHAELVELPRLLDMLPADELPPAALPPALEERLLDRFARDRRGTPVASGGRRRPRRRRWPRVAIAVAALAAVAAAGAAALVDEREPSPRSYTVALRAAPAAPGATARAALQRTSGGTRVRLRVSGLPPDPAVVYELMCERADGAGASAGTFRVDAGGRADVVLTTAARVGEYERLRVVRRASGLSAAPEPADVLVARLH